MPKKYAIVQGGEFYPDPIYTDKKEAEDKVKYLHDYRVENNMPTKQYCIEVLTPEREAQHGKEWKAYCDMID